MAIVHDFELDVRGEACPYPLIRTKQRWTGFKKVKSLKSLPATLLRRRISMRGQRNQGMKC